MATHGLSFKDGITFYNLKKKYKISQPFTMTNVEHHEGKIRWLRSKYRRDNVIEWEKEMIQLMQTNENTHTVSCLGLCLYFYLCFFMCICVFLCVFVEGVFVLFVFCVVFDTKGLEGQNISYFFSHWFKKLNSAYDDILTFPVC